MVEVEVGGDIERAIRLLKKGCEGLMKELKGRSYAMTRTQRRKRKDKMAAQKKEKAARRKESKR